MARSRSVAVVCPVEFTARPSTLPPAPASDTADITTMKCQAADHEMFRHVGIEPVRQRVMALKSSVRFGG